MFTFLHVTDPELLARIHRFRYEIYCEELEYGPPNDELAERDQYDAYSDQFVALDAEGNVCASMRLVHHSPVGYPTENGLDLPDEVKIYPRDKLGEMSRIFIHPKYRNMKDTKTLISTIVKTLAYEKLKEYGIEYSYGALSHSFLKLVNMFKIPYMPIGPAQKYGGNDFRFPSILHTRGLELYNPQILRQQHKERSAEV